jgi:hypothetical protein
MCHTATRVKQETSEGRGQGENAGGRVASGQAAARVWPAEQRVGDREREEAMQVLTDAFAEGRLSREEFDDRSAQALAARTGNDLGALVDDLPPRQRVPVPSGDRLPQRVMVEIQSYLAVMVLLVAIWFVVGIAAQAWYPWFIWPAIGWGLGIAGRVRRVARYDATA